MSFNKSWTPKSNQAISAPATATILNATIWLNFIKERVTAGWSVVGSSNGGRATVNSSAGSKTIAFVSGTTWSLTDTTSAAFTADMVGTLITLSGFANGGNNHAFRVTAFTSSTTIQFAQGAFTPVAETAAAGASWSVAADASSTDGVDRLSSGTANFAWNTAGNAHWWVILESPAGMLPSANRLWQTYMGDQATGSPHLFSVADANTAPSSGSTTANPTQNGSNRTNSGKQATPSGSTANHNWHDTYSSIGDHVFGVSRNTLGYIAFVEMVATATLGNETSFDYDFVCLHVYQDSSRGALTMGNLSASTSNTTMFHSNGTIEDSASGLTGWFSAAGTSLPTLYTNSNGQSNTSSKTVDFPIALYATTASQQAFKGQLTDFAWAPAPTASIQGKSDPNVAATVNSVVWGDVFVPMPGLTADLSL